MRKRLTRFVLIILLLLVGIWLYRHPDWPSSFKNLFSSKQLEIENTAIVVQEINALAQLVTITSYNEVVMEEVIKGAPIFNNPAIPTILSVPNLRYSDSKLVLIGKGKVLAGIDLAKLTNKDVFIKEDSIAITLPKAQILQTIINPSDYDTFEETGSWNDEETRAVKVKLRDKLVATVLQQGILQKATVKAKLVMENFISNVGFKKVTVLFAP